MHHVILAARTFDGVATDQGGETCRSYCRFVRLAQSANRFLPLDDELVRSRFNPPQIQIRRKLLF
jgi:hypothetical protein